jgi:alpha-tubulin suppressor-like RCC1 family protein
MVHVRQSDWVFVYARPTVNNATVLDSAITWKIDDGSIAWFSRLKDTVISVWGAKPGTTRLTARIGTKSTTISIEVGPEALAAIYADARVLGVSPGGSSKVTAYTRTIDGNDAHGPLDWSSDDPTIAEVAADGTVFGKNAGSTHVHVRGGTAAASIAVHVPTEFTKVTAGFLHSCALKNDGRTFCWGENSSGQLGRAMASPTELPDSAKLPLRFAELRATPAGTCGRTISDEVYCWGIVVNRSLTPERIGFPEPIKQLTAGARHICALAFTGKVYCYGYGLAAAAPPNTIAEPTSEIPSPVAFVSVVAGSWHTCALDVSGEAYCWGEDDHGQLGDSLPEQTPNAGRITPARVAGGHHFISLFSGPIGTHTCGLSDSGANYCWGSYVESNTAATTASCRTLPPESGGVTRCSPVPVRVSIADALTFITTMGNSGCGLTAVGKLYCWGRTPDQNYATQSPRRLPEIIDFQQRFTDLAYGLDHVCGLNTDRVISCWGANQKEEAGQDFQIYVAPAPNLVYGRPRIASPTVIASP